MLILPVLAVMPHGGRRDRTRTRTSRMIEGEDGTIPGIIHTPHSKVVERVRARARGIGTQTPGLRILVMDVRPSEQSHDGRILEDSGRIAPARLSGTIACKEASISPAVDAGPEGNGIKVAELTIVQIRA